MYSDQSVDIKKPSSRENKNRLKYRSMEEILLKPDRTDMEEEKKRE